MNQPYFEKRVDNDTRWDFIESHLVDEESLLDIGCAEGYMAYQAADYGLTAVGIDTSLRRLNYGEESWGSDGELVLEQGKVTPENVRNLPPVDVVFFLTVHHHVFNRYGSQPAMELFEMLCRKADKVFYEPRGDQWPPLYAVTVTAENVATDTVHQTTLTARRRTYSELDVPEGTYNVTVHADGYGTTDPVQLTVSDSGKLDRRLQIRQENGELVVETGVRTDSPVPANTEYYRELLSRLCDNRVTVLDAIEVGHKGHRTDPLFVLDTSACDPVRNPDRAEWGAVWDAFEE